MVLLGVGAAIYSLVLVPQQEARAQAAQQIERFETVSARLDSAGPMVAARPLDTRPVPAIVAESARDRAIPIQRLEPEGALTRLSLDTVGFDTLMLWLADLDTLHRVRVASIEMERQLEPGTVTARIALER